MNKIIITLTLLIIIYGFYNAKNAQRPKTAQESSRSSIEANQNTKLSHLQKELQEINSPSYARDYIVTVIDRGSHDLGFKGGVMEGGFVAHEDAYKVACFTLELSGKHCPNPYPKDAQMFYTSVCGGCHGNDGKGLGGNYPDLTRKTLLGIEKREAYLKREIFMLGR